jgi:FkbM family methyltransferase
MFNKIIHKIFGFRLVNSQCGEDLIIESLLPFKKSGFYVDIGANHPTKFNNTRLFYNKGWRGINIEPNPQRLWLFNIFRRGDKNLNIGVGGEKSEMIFYVFKENTLSTFSQQASIKYTKMGHKVKEQLAIRLEPLKDILSQYAKNQEIDIMSVDTEGFDMEVLESNDWNTFRPRFLILETLEYRKNGLGKKLNSVFDPYMEKVGYKKVADTYINTIYEKNY